MVRWEPLSFFYKRAKRPFYFPLERLRLARFSGQVFTFDYNAIGRFFFVLLELGLKGQALYRVPNLLQETKPLFRGRYVPYVWEHLFLFHPGYFFYGPFVRGAVGYFPISFFNGLALGFGFGKHSWDYGNRGLLWQKSIFKPTLRSVLVDVDSHLSLLFGSKSFFFPKFSNYISSFKYAMEQVYLITGGHNISSYALDAEASSFQYGVVSVRRYKDFFFRNFFRGLKKFFLQRLFSLAGVVPARGPALLNFFFDYYYSMVSKIFIVLCFLKLSLGFLFFYGSFLCASFKFFLVEFLAFFQRSRSFSLWLQPLVLRRFFLRLLRLFFLSGFFPRVFGGSFLPLGLAATLRFSKGALLVPLFTDLRFASGLGLRQRFLRSMAGLYRESVFRGGFPRRVFRKRPWRTWQSFFAPKDVRKKRRRWIEYIMGFYRKRRKKRRIAVEMSHAQQRYAPGYIYPSAGRALICSYRRPFALASSLFEGLVDSESNYGSSLFHLLSPGSRWSDYRVALLHYVATTYNEYTRRRYGLALQKKAKASADEAGVFSSLPFSLPDTIPPLTVKDPGRRRRRKLRLLAQLKRKLLSLNPQRLRFARRGFRKSLLCGRSFAPKSVFFGGYGSTNGLCSFTDVVRLARERKSLQVRRRRSFVFLTASFVFFLIALFGLSPSLFRKLSFKGFYGLRHPFFIRLKKKLLRRKGFSFKRLVASKVKGRRGAFKFFRERLLLRRKKYPRKRALLLWKKRSPRLAFANYNFCYFFLSSFYPIIFTLKRVFYFFKVELSVEIPFNTFERVLLRDFPEVLRGEGSALALKTFRGMAFPRFSFFDRRLVAFLFRVYDRFGFARRLRFLSTKKGRTPCHFYVSFALKLFFLRKLLNQGLVVRVRKRPKAPRPKVFRRFFHRGPHRRGAFEKRFYKKNRQGR